MIGGRGAGFKSGCSLAIFRFIFFSPKTSIRQPCVIMCPLRKNKQSTYLSSRSLELKKPRLPVNRFFLLDQNSKNTSVLKPAICRNLRLQPSSKASPQCSTQGKHPVEHVMKDMLSSNGPPENPIRAEGSRLFYGE